MDALANRKVVASSHISIKSTLFADKKLIDRTLKGHSLSRRVIGNIIKCDYTKQKISLFTY